MIARLKHLPWGMVGMLALVCGVERSISRHRADVTTETASNYEFAATSAVGEALGSEILGFGDSLMKFGFLPKVIEARTGRRAYNLAAYGGPPSRDYLLLKRVLDAGGKPSALVVCFQVVHMGATPRFHARRFAEFVTAAEALDLAWSARDPGLFGWLMVGRNLPSLRARFELRGNLMTALQGHGLRWADVYYPMRRNWKQSRGAHIAAAEPHAPGEPELARARALELYPDFYYDLSSRKPVEEQYIRRFLDLAAERNIPVYWTIPPEPPAVEVRQTEVHVTAITDGLLKRMSDAYPNLVIVDGRGQGYDPSAFSSDDVHLNRVGANAFSRDVADVIRHRQGNPSPASSRVALPRYRAGSMVADLEDYDQSAAVLRKAWAVRR